MSANEPRVTCIHGETGCPQCKLAASLYDWSVREITQFMCTDEMTPAAALALEVFMGIGT